MKLLDIYGQFAFKNVWYVSLEEFKALFPIEGEQQIPEKKREAKAAHKGQEPGYKFEIKKKLHQGQKLMQLPPEA